jgi:membrane associated rhomboid family serine protease
MIDDNVIPFQPRPQPEPPKAHRPPPMLNLPSITKFLGLALITIHTALFLITEFINPDIYSYALFWGGFTPALWSGAEPGFSIWTLLSLISFSFLHGSWLHLGFNVVMLVAMGSGLEKILGIKRYIFIYSFTTLFSVFAHLAFFYDSTMPIVGASGGISGIFGAMLYIMTRPNSTMNFAGQNKLWPIAIVYIGITILVGFIGAPDGSPIAWIAHVAGFVAGLGIMAVMVKRLN